MNRVIWAIPTYLDLYRNLQSKKPGAAPNFLIPGLLPSGRALPDGWDDHS
jgi:hypothetical protein